MVVEDPIRPENSDAMASVADRIPVPIELANDSLEYTNFRRYSRRMHWSTRALMWQYVVG